MISWWWWDWVKFWDNVWYFFIFSRFFVVIVFKILFGGRFGGSSSGSSSWVPRVQPATLSPTCTRQWFSCGGCGCGCRRSCSSWRLFIFVIFIIFFIQGGGRRGRWLLSTFLFRSFGWHVHRILEYFQYEFKK